MHDPRIHNLAKLLMRYSCELKENEKVLIEGTGISLDVFIILIQEAKAVGAVPFINIKDDQIIREQCNYYKENDIKIMAECELYTLQKMDAFIGMRGFMNINELAKLKTLLEYWIEHNREHSQEFGEWAEKAKALGEEEVSQSILEAVQEMDSSGQLLAQALKKLGGK